MKDTVTVATKLKGFYSSFTSDSLQDLSNIYHKNVEFTDPIHTVKGLDALHSYFEKVMRQTQDCTFTFSDQIVSESGLCLPWVMRFKHPKLNSGKTIKVDGNSIVRVDADSQKIIYHQDYYDLGSMLYEHVPVLGFAVNKVKNRMK